MLSIDVARALSVSRPRPRSWSPPPAPHMEEDSVLGRVVATAREAGVLAGLEGGGLALFTTERGSVVLGLLEDDLALARCRDTRGRQWYRTTALLGPDRAEELASIVLDCFERMAGD